MHTPRMAACGMDCAECGSYRVTMAQDRQAAEALAPWYRGNGWIGENEGAEAVLRKAPLCRGCWDSGDDCFFKCGCGSTDFRVCCNEKNIRHCGECADFPCKHYRFFVDMAPHHREAMARLQALRAKE